jgi:hypothetical protein
VGAAPKAINKNRQRRIIFMKNKLKIILFLFFLLIFTKTSVFGQEYKSLFKIDTPVKFIQVDPLQNLYVITPKNAVIKYDSTGRKIFAIEFKEFGAFDQLDVSNPLELVFFYSNLNQVLITDNNLNILRRIELVGSPVQQFSVAARSSEGGYWLYDVTDAKLKRIDQNKQIAKESQSLQSVGIRDLNPVYLIESLPWLYMSIPSTGILIFDSYGAYLKTIQIKNVNKFQVLNIEEKSDAKELLETRNDHIIFLQDQKLNDYDLKSFEQKRVNLPFFSGDVQDVKVSRRKLWVQKKKGIEVYRY